MGLFLIAGYGLFRWRKKFQYFGSEPDAAQFASDAAIEGGGQDILHDSASRDYPVGLNVQMPPIERLVNIDTREIGIGYQKDSNYFGLASI